MPTYFWRGHLLSKQPARGTLKAANFTEARAELARRKIIRPILIPIAFEFSEIAFSRRISAQEITVLLQQLATLLNSGLTLARALTGILDGLKPSPLRDLVEQIYLEVEQGTPFSQVLAKRRRYFDPFLIHLVEAGETSGQMGTLLNRAAEHRKKSQHLKKQVRKAAIYPVSVFVVALSITAFLLLAVVPQFESLFQNLGGSLPPLTRHLLNLSDALQQNIYLLLISLILSFSIPILLYQKQSKFRIFADHFLLQIPLFGMTFRDVALARLSRTLATLQEAAVPIHVGLATSANMIPNQILQQAIRTARTAVLRGTTLSSALEQRNVFPMIAIQMIRAGEESGKLATMLLNLADYYENEVEQRIQTLTTLIEPTLILLIGGMIGTLTVALYQPIFQAGSLL